MTNKNEQQRVTELESQVMHLEHQLDQLNSVILKQQEEIDEVRKQLGHLETNIDMLSDNPEDRDPLDEKPPHY